MAKISEFRKIVYTHYKENRRDFPWRRTADPYRILVSEIMLQQTQTDRVVPKYRAFIKKFPTVRKLAAAPLSAVLVAWSGLGYNRRGRMLHEAAKKIVAEYAGKMPTNPALIDELPGVGEYTARAVAAFSFNVPSTLIETNIRAAYIHHFFPRAKKVPDTKLLPLIGETLDYQNPREWYWALMDYGSYLKKTNPNPSRRSAHHAKQSKFEGSFRQLRGMLLRLLLEKPESTLGELARKTKRPEALIEPAFLSLKKDGLV